jgi:hypothetical protein
VLTKHAILRIAERGLAESDVHYVCQHGKRIIRAGAIHIFLGKKDIPKDDLRVSQYARLEGTTVLVCSRDNQTILTVYRNKHGFKKIRCKKKYYQLPLAN